MPKHISKETKISIVNYYKSKPMTIEDVSEKFNISPPSIIKILNEYRIKRYSKSKLFSPNLKEDYFDIIDTEHKAYFLGLIITDGCVHYAKGKSPTVNLALDEKDRYIIEEFKKEISSNKLVTHDGRGCCEISISSAKMANDLKKYSVIPNKSLNTVLSKDIPNNLYNHFLRGIFDGDGSMSFYARQNRKSHTKAVRLCQGNEKFLLDIVDFLYENLGVEKINTYKEKDSLWSIAYRKNDSMIKIIKYLYSNAHIYMSRKKEICDLICEEIYRYGNTEITNESKVSLAS